MNQAGDLLGLLGRLLIGAIFLYSGVLKAMAPAATQATFAKLGIAPVHLAFYAALVIEIVVPVAFVLGWKARWAAFILAGWCIATGLLVHFHPADKGQMIHLLKNLCMAGGLLQTVAFGAGRFSLDRR